MKNLFHKGDTKIYEKVVKESDIAAFESGMVHDVYATFSIAKDAEWSGRLFVLDMKDEEEEGIGTFISVVHRSPAFIGDTVVFTACFEEISDKGEIITSFQAFVKNRLIAEGRQGQKILPKDKIRRIFNDLKHGTSA